jgi:hypothetical protein
MARFGSSQGVSRSTGKCAATGEEIPHATPAIAALCELEEDEGFVRFDYSIEAWEKGDRPDRLFSHWRYTTPEEGKKPDIVIDEAVLVDLFERLDGDERPQRIAFRYIIALVLLRKRKLKLVGREQADGGETWLLRWSGTDGEVAKIHNPGIQEDEIHGLSDQLSDLLQGDM